MTSTAEKYASATTTSNLTLELGRLCDADSLLAAGIASSKDPRKALALSIYRAAVTGDHAGMNQITETLADWLAGNGARNRDKPLSRPARKEIAASVLKYLFNSTCQSCNGLGYIKVEGAPVLSDHVCGICLGTGKKPLDRHVPIGKEEQARWLLTEIERLMALIHGDMAKLLSQRMSLEV